jgi:hypothetical protein
MKWYRRLMAVALALALSLVLAAPALASETSWEDVQYWYGQFTVDSRETLAALIDMYGAYDDVVRVGMYLFVYGELPGNYITKADARALGWPGGSLEPYAPGKCIGGDRFGNYEGLLPEGETYTECDIGTLGADSRGAERLVFNDSGDIYYTQDHYESFTLLHEGGTGDAVH